MADGVSSVGSEACQRSAMCLHLWVCVCVCVESRSERNARHSGCESGQLSNTAMSAWHFPSYECFLGGFFSLCLSLIVFSSFIHLFSTSLLPVFPHLFFPLFLWLCFYLSSLWPRSLLLSPRLSAGRGKCRRSFSKRQYSDNCSVVTVTWQGSHG